MFRRFGIEVGWERNTLAATRRGVLHSGGITLVLDVGANTGQYAQELRKDGYTGTIASFEPLRGAYEELAVRARGQSNWQCFRTALGAGDGEVNMNVSRASVASSVLAVLDRHVDAQPDLATVACEPVPIATLDSACLEIARPHRNIYLKIDTQGYELEVLKGCRELLQRLGAVELELTLAPVYRDQPLLPEVWTYLQQCGYRPIWVERGYLDPRTGHMLQADALFVRELS